MGSESFRTLDAWRAARRLVREIYEFTGRFPPDERFVLAQQMRRAVHSVHSNIAEGCGRLSTGEWQQFLGQARGSVLELESDVIAAFDLKYCTQEEAAEVTKQITRVAQLINGLLASNTKGFASKKFKPDKPNKPANG